MQGMAERGTRMVHYHCDVCGMTATCVATPAAVLAWMDHMGRHVRTQDYGVWTWEVVALPLGASPDAL